MNNQMNNKIDNKNRDIGNKTSKEELNKYKKIDENDSEIEELTFENDKIKLSTKIKEDDSKNSSINNTKFNISQKNDSKDVVNNDVSNVSSGVDENKSETNKPVMQQPDSSSDQNQNLIDDNEPDSYEGNRDNRSLSEKYNDAKENLKDKAEKIKNAPENIKKRYEDAKENLKDKAEKIKNAPENIKNKYNDAKDNLKDKWNNRPKSASELKDRMKDHAKNTADRAKNRAIDLANKTKDAAIDKARDAYENSELGQKIENAKNKVEKAKKVADKTKKAAKATAKAAKGLFHLFIDTLPWSAIIIAVIILILGIVLMIAYLPGVGGKVEDDAVLSEYSKTDQKTLEKLKKLFNKYPNADGSLAMATVLYPYFETLQNGEVNSYLQESTDEEPEEIDDTTDVDEDGDDAEDSEDVEEDQDDLVADDMYLVPFRKYKLRKRLKNVLKKLNSGSEDEFKTYLKDKYFKQDKGYSGYEGDAFNGYKEMIDSVKNENRDSLKDAIIDNLYDIKDLFINYVSSATICSASSTSLGYSDGTDLIKGQAVVVLKDTSASNFESIKSATTLYNTDDYSLDLKRYTLGVVYGEVGIYLDNEQLAKAAMIAAKSVVLGRNVNENGKGSLAQMGRRPDYVDDKSVFYMRCNANDQVFCDVYEGCNSSSKYAWNQIKNDSTGQMNPTGYPALSSEKIALLEKWYDETAGEFIYDDDAKAYYAAYLATSYSSYCKKGACLLQTLAYNDAQNGSTYDAILKKYFSDDKYVIKNIETNVISSVSVSCSSLISGGCTIPANEFKYYSQRDYNNTNFCGRTDATISSSGCGVTSMAMILANLVDGNIDPVSTMNEAYNGSYCGKGISGTNSAYFKAAAEKYNLTYEMLSASDTSDSADSKIKEVLKSGGLIIANVSGSETAGKGKPWSTVTSGHFLVIKGITEDDKLIIADPMAKSLSSPWKNNIDIDEMRSYMYSRYFHLFTGGKSDEVKEKYCKVGVTTGVLQSPFDVDGTTKLFDQSTVPYGYNASTGCGSSKTVKRADCTFHGGNDLSVGEGTNVYAVDGGKVIKADYDNDLGYYVALENTYQDKTYVTLYQHLSSYLVNVGDGVSKGQLIAKSGNTGSSQGPHLHLEIIKGPISYKLGAISFAYRNENYRVNPYDYISGSKKGQVYFNN